MKGYFRYAPVGGALLALFFLSGCSRLRKEIEQHPSDIGKYCRLTSLTQHAANGGLTHFNFTYNSAGEPAELVQADNLLSGTGLDLHFRYDRKGRLSDVLETDPGQTMVYLWDRYSYPTSGVVVDSVFEYQGHLSDANPPYATDEQERIDVLKLDGAGRIINSYSYSSNGSIAPSSYNISYDRNGDVIGAGVVYDDMVNCYETSPVWQLHYRDYSRHNPVLPPPGTLGLPTSPASYDAYGLPTKFLGSSEALFGIFVYTELDLAYSCDVSAPSTVN